MKDDKDPIEEMINDLTAAVTIAQMHRRNVELCMPIIEMVRRHKDVPAANEKYVFSDEVRVQAEKLMLLNLEKLMEISTKI